MKRSIVQQGPTTLMVSLPIKWVRKYGLEKGGELELDEYGNKLTISTEKKPEGAKTEIEIDSSDQLYIWRRLQPLYILGYDEIKIKFKDTKTLDKIQGFVINYLIGYELIHQEKDYCIIKSISTESEERFDSILRMIFLNINQMSEIISNYLQKKEIPLSILNLEQMNNRHTMFLKRLLIKDGYSNTKKIPFMYTLIVLLEKIANEFKFIAWHVRDNKNIETSKKIIDQYRNVHKLITHIYKSFYSYDEAIIKEIITSDIRVDKLKILLEDDVYLAAGFMRIVDLERTCLFQIMAIKT